MTKYKNYYIDGVIFHSKKEIDDFLKNSAIESCKKAIQLFCKYKDIPSSDFATEKEEILVNYFGFTWEEIEQLEIETMKAI